MKLRLRVRWLAALLILAGGGAGLAAALSQMHGPDRALPAARVERGDLDLRVYTNGELRPVRTAMLVAPRVRGTLQIVHLAKTGKRVKAGDIVVEFDPSEQEFNLEQSRSELLEAEQEITKMRADAAVQEAEDKEALLKAQFDVKRWELEVKRSEVLSAVDAQKNQLSLEEAQRRLAQLEEDLQSRQASNRASLAVLEEKRNKARLAMEQAQQDINNMRVRAPMDGLVSVKENRDASGGFFFTGMVLPEYREGDTVWPGRFIAEVADIGRLEILARVSEQDRANLEPEQEVEIHLDARPESVYRGTVKSVAGLASRDRFFSSDSQRTFDATFEITGPKDPAAQSSSALQPGVTAKVVILTTQLRDALHVPRQAVFEKDGKTIVYLRQGNRYEPREVQVRYRTETRAVLEGLPEGTEVALVNPEESTKKPAKGAAAGPAVGGGR